MKLETGSKNRYALTMDTHMGILTGELTLSQESEISVRGSIVVMGKNILFDTCTYSPDVYSANFRAMNMTVNMWLSVNPDGSVYGFATAPRHQVMELRGMANP